MPNLEPKNFRGVPPPNFVNNLTDFWTSQFSAKHSIRSDVGQLKYSVNGYTCCEYFELIGFTKGLT